jgi:hypothetical protein
MQTETTPLVACENCDWRGQPDDLQPVCDLLERVAPGEPMPAGQCPDCGALAHYLDDTPPRD